MNPDLDLTAELQKAASSTFEQLGFLLPETDLSEEQAQAEVMGSCRVRFRGPRSGALEIEVAGDFLLELASNMLGGEEASSPEILVDALGEVANVICGNVLPSLAGPEAVFDLSAPESALKPLPPSAHAQGPVARAVMGVEEGRAEITIRLYG
jgi:CheY-specific phosphatase CheX